MTIRYQDKYLLPSPAGAWHCISAPDTEPARQFLQQLMTFEESPHFDADTINSLLPDSDIQESLLYHIQQLKWLQGFSAPRSVPQGNFDESLPDLLATLSSEHKTLLADDEGFFLAGSGFTHEASEELAALGADLSALYTRHEGIVSNNLNINSSAFALVDAAGYSRIGFWPLYIGELRFNLVISGAPRFEQQNFVDLVWILHKRYYRQKHKADSAAA